jgi:hypothetical protein
MDASYGPNIVEGLLFLDVFEMVRGCYSRCVSVLVLYFYLAY